MIKEKFVRLVRFFIPPDRWQLPVVLLLGVFCGLCLMILTISNATSYLSDKPEACMNCHVMASQYATWQRGSHGRNTVCNDCHVPHDNFIHEYAFHANDGLRHSFMFTFRLEPQVINVKEAGISVIQQNCIRCHSHLVDRASISLVTGENRNHGSGRLCWECHRETPHGRVNSLASVPYAHVPRLSPVMPQWIEDLYRQQQKK